MSFTQISNSPLKVLSMTSQGVDLLDQTAIPSQVRYVTITTASAMAKAITDMLVRGAPAIGIAAAFGVVLSAREACKTTASANLASIKQTIQQDIAMLREARPTAVNLMWALNQMRESLLTVSAVEALLPTIESKAQALYDADLTVNHTIGVHGAALIPKGAKILTHCNAGALATVGHGTALGVIRTAYENDPSIQVFADETRPRQQGAKLTVWELQQDGIPVTLLTDGMSGSLMRSGQVNVVIVGADRIAKNGDTANKIGTYNLAIVASYHKIPFYVAAPTSTFDLSIPDGSFIPIEFREASEVLRCGDAWIADPDTAVYNPGFDVTPAALIAGIITEQGIFRMPYCF